MKVFFESTYAACERARFACGRKGRDHEDRSIRYAWGHAAQLDAMLRNNRLSRWMGAQIWYA